MKEEYYKIDKPIYPKNLSQKLAKLDFKSKDIKNIVSEANNRYLPWQEFKNKSWVPNQDKEVLWYYITLIRKYSNTDSPVIDQQGRNFCYNPSRHTELLHKIDLELGGNFMGIDGFNEGDKQEFVRRNLIEESIASSQLEGANTSRSAAKKMLLENRKPVNESEQMIVNNHQTMKWIEEDLLNEELSLDIIFELHKKITKDTIDKKHIAVLRETLDEKGNPLTVRPGADNIITYVAPPKEFVEENIEKLILFANNKGNEEFIHPLIKAIIIHFWIGLLHPFEDGNGRLARILFYWYMLKQEYWAFSYLSLSEIILKSPKQYSMAYIYTEQDSNDLNYFINYNINKLELARQNFAKFIKSKVSDNKRNLQLIKQGYNLNKRQLNLLQYLAKDEQRYTSLVQHCQINQVGKVTASKDLKHLVNLEFLEKIRNGKNIIYAPLPTVKKSFI